MCNKILISILFLTNAMTFLNWSLSVVWKPGVRLVFSRSGFFGSEKNHGFVWKSVFTLNRLPFWEGKLWLANGLWGYRGYPNFRQTYIDQIEIWFPDVSLCSCKKRDAMEFPTTFSDAKDVYWKPNMLCLMKSYVYLFTVAIWSSHPKYSGFVSFPWNLQFCTPDIWLEAKHGVSSPHDLSII